MQKTDSFELKPIGRVKNRDGEFLLELDRAFRPGLNELDAFSHVLVLWWADKHDNAASRATVETELPYAEGRKAGVFACRSEYRPNPVAMTVCLMTAVDIERGRVSLAYIDAADGTPVIDLKPYIPVCERVRDARVPGWFAHWPEWYEDGAVFFAKLFKAGQ